MIKVEHIEVWGFEHATRGVRNPLNSWAKSDSGYGCKNGTCKDCDSSKYCENVNRVYVLGKNDLDLMHRLYKAGTEHRKYLRQMFVSMDVTAPLYWYKELDTYKVGTTSNSCSTMHKIHSSEITLADFSLEHTKLCDAGKEYFMELERIRQKYVATNDKKYWYALIQLLPSSYNQKRTLTMSYENVMNIIHQRENHKLDEWREFVKVLKGLPYIAEIRGE